VKRSVLAALVAVLALACACALVACSNGGTTQPSSGATASASSSSASASESSSPASASSSSASVSSSSSKDSKAKKKVDYSTGIHHARIKFKGYSTPIVLEIYSDSAPVSSSKFAELVKKGYYNGKTLYWCLNGIYLKFGNPKQDDNNLITGEYADSDYNNSNSLKKGVIALARAEDGEQSDASSVIVFLNDMSYLDGKYAGFGRITDGYEVIEDIVSRTQSSPDDSNHISTNDKGKITKKSERPVIKSIKMVD
jgi:peptidyl-prolyl cis-trans isomerase B (cyclophilin B)